MVLRRKLDPESHAWISPSAVIGANVKIGQGAIIDGTCCIGDNCIIGPGVVLAPGDDEYIAIDGEVRIMASATLVGPVHVARGAAVQPGAVVTRNVPPYAIVAGNPGRITGYTGAEHRSKDATRATLPDATGEAITRVRGVTLHRLPKVLDLRGNITIGEFGRTIPFEPKRYFMVFGVPTAEVRGEHAHRTCHQFLVCAHGSCSVVADDGVNRSEFELSDPSVGLYLPAFTWGIQYKYSPSAVLLVFASEFYDPAEYIRSYSEFLELVSRRG